MWLRHRWRLIQRKLRTGEYNRLTRGWLRNRMTRGWLRNRMTRGWLQCNSSSALCSQCVTLGQIPGHLRGSEGGAEHITDIFFAYRLQPECFTHLSATCDTQCRMWHSNKWHTLSACRRCECGPLHNHYHTGNISTWYNIGWWSYAYSVLYPKYCLNPLTAGAEYIRVFIFD